MNENRSGGTGILGRIGLGIVVFVFKVIMAQAGREAVLLPLALLLIIALAWGSVYIYRVIATRLARSHAAQTRIVYPD
ncbi:MAG TPA: hypothetical protein VKU19_22285 [Bryobacteraceae bacterium]|nr:hypothetical protein [Bryobacteraceae bacterium]